MSYKEFTKHLTHAVGQKNFQLIKSLKAKHLLALIILDAFSSPNVRSNSLSRSHYQPKLSQFFVSIANINFFSVLEV